MILYQVVLCDISYAMMSLLFVVFLPDLALRGHDSSDAVTALNVQQIKQCLYVFTCSPYCGHSGQVLIVGILGHAGPERVISLTDRARPVSLPDVSLDPAGPRHTVFVVPSCGYRQVQRLRFRRWDPAQAFRPGRCPASVPFAAGRPETLRVRRKFVVAPRPEYRRTANLTVSHGRDFAADRHRSVRRRNGGRGTGSGGFYSFSLGRPTAVVNVFALVGRRRVRSPHDPRGAARLCYDPHAMYFPRLRKKVQRLFY